MLSLFAPYTAEEMWARLGTSPPSRGPAGRSCRRVAAGRGVGHLRRPGRRQGARPLDVSPSIAEDELRELALASDAVQRALDGREIRTVIVRAPKLVNVVPA